MLFAIIFTLFIPLIFFYFIKLFLLFIKKEVNTEGCNKVCDTLIKVAKAIMKFLYLLILLVFLFSTCNAILGNV